MPGRPLEAERKKNGAQTLQTLGSVQREATKEPETKEAPISGRHSLHSALTPYLPTGPAGSPMPGSPVPASPAHPQWGLSRDQVWL